VIGDAVAQGVDGLTSAIASMLVEHEVSLAIRPSWESIRSGRVGTVRARIGAVGFAGLRLTSIDVAAHDVGIRPALPPHLLARAVDATATIEQRSVDQWSRRLRLPARLVITPSGLMARFGVAGLRLGQIDMNVAASAGGVRLSPRRLTTFGIDVQMQDQLDIRLPIPLLPAGAELTAVDWGAGTGSVTVHVDDLDMAFGWAELHRLRRMARQAIAPLDRDAQSRAREVTVEPAANTTPRGIAPARVPSGGRWQDFVGAPRRPRTKSRPERGSSMPLRPASSASE
jgi:hypothetical protein